MMEQVKLIRPLNCFVAGIAVIVSIFIASSFSLDIITAMAFGVVFLITAGGNSINDYFDYKSDKVNNPSRPIPSGLVSRKQALFMSIFLFGSGITLAYFINIYVLALVLFNILILSLYSKIKEKTPYGNLVIGYLVGSIFLFGGLVVESITIVGILGILAALATIAREITKDIEDVKGDKNRKKTLATYYGERKAGIIAAFFLLIAILLSPLPYKSLGFPYLYSVFFADSIFFYCALRLLYNPKKYASDIQRLEKLGMFVGLIAFLAGVYF